MLSHGTELLTLCSYFATAPQALRVGIRTFRVLLADGLAESEGVRCTLKQEEQTAVQLSDGWLVDDKVYTDKQFRRLFNCD